MPTLKIEHSPASIDRQIAKLYEEYIYDCQLSDQVKHFFPYPYSKFRAYKRLEQQGAILDIQDSFNGQEGFEESEFFNILALECIVDVYRNKNNFTVEQNEQIDIICYCNRLKTAAQQGHLEVPCKIDFTNIISDRNFSLLINALEDYQHHDGCGFSSGWALLAAAFLLADIIETKVDLSEKTNEDIDHYWNKRFHDSISFAIKAADSAPAYKDSAHGLLLHIKAVAGEYYPDIKQRLNTILLEPNLETFNLFKRDPVQALLQYKGNFFNIKLPKDNEEINSPKNKILTKLENSFGNKP